MTSNLPDRPLDHATARIVTELAAALLPPLKESLTAEMVEALAFPSRQVVQELEDTLASSGKCLEDVRQKERLIRDIPDHALRLEDLCRRLEISATRLTNACPEAQQEANFGAEDETWKKFQRSLEIAISDWGGILKADGRAQTRELSEFSAEISELMGEMKSSLPQTLKEAVIKEIELRDEKWMNDLREAKRLTDQRLSKIEKLLVLCITALGLCLTVAAVLLLA